MPFRTEWYAEKRIMRQTYYGTLTLQEFQDSHYDYLAYVQAGTPLIHCLADLTDLREYPTNISQIIGVMNHVDNSSMGWIVIYGATNPILGFICNTILQVVLKAIRIKFVNSKVEALAFLQDRDETLIPLLRDQQPVLASAGG
jgi:hypothetical protein